MKTLKLSALPRVYLISILNEEGQKGKYNLSDLNKFFKILDKVEFKEEDRKRLSMKADGDQLMWNTFVKDEEGKDTEEKADIEQEFELSDDQVKLLQEVWKRRDEEKEFSLAQVASVSHIAEQIGYIFAD